MSMAVTALGTAMGCRTLESANLPHSESTTQPESSWSITSFNLQDPMSKKFTPSLSNPPPHTAPSSSEDLNSQLAENQLLRELVEAAVSGMVSTRSHNHALEDVDSNAQMRNDTSISTFKKRKLERAVEETPKGGHVKRRRSSNESLATKSNEEPAPRRRSGRFRPAVEISDEPAEEAHYESTEVADHPMFKIGAEEVKALANHKRFGSQESEVDAFLDSVQKTATDKEEQSEEGENSDDDVPEALTAAAGFKASRAAAVDAAKIAETQEAALRVKRREHHARLKAQAEAAKLQRTSKAKASQKANNISATSPKADDEIDAQERQTFSKKSTKAPLPALLPYDLLAANPAVRPPTPPSSIDRQITSKKKKILDLESKAPKDIRRGNTMIRVLQVEKSTLPPKSSAASMSIREKWLTGQRGSLGGTGVPRKKTGGGFLRR